VPNGINTINLKPVRAYMYLFVVGLMTLPVAPTVSMGGSDVYRPEEIEC